MFPRESSVITAIHLFCRYGLPYDIVVDKVIGSLLDPSGKDCFMIKD